jgi:bifunctional UDP-N-acetylglucosamine pyrophosphorylase/glucosamine-1-phosphate N-acetyltransferase
MTTGPSPLTIPVVLAAGLGTRMRSRTPKVLHAVCGRPMLGYVLDAAREATGQRPLVVYSPATDAVCAAFPAEADFALQDEPRGTADAVRAALDVLPDDVDEIVVLSGDVPLIRSETVARLVDQRRVEQAPMALLTMRANDPAGLGRVLRDGRGRVARIVEERDATPEQLQIEEINVGLYGFDVRWLRRRLPEVRPSASNGELYLPALVELANGDGLSVTGLMVPPDGTLEGINNRVQLVAQAAVMRSRIAQRHLLAGVTIEDPSRVMIDGSVELAEDVTLEPDVVLRGTTRIGRDTVVRSGSQVVDSVVGERCVIWASVLESATVEDDVRIGPFSHLRPGARIESGAELGNFAEVKASRIGRGTRQHHFSYIGDADVGEGVNIGAGTITANYDGRSKHRTTIGDRAFIGSDTILRAPITVGEDAVTGAGSVVTHDVPPDTIVVGVPARTRSKRPAEDTGSS